MKRDKVRLVAITMQSNEEGESKFTGGYEYEGTILAKDNLVTVGDDGKTYKVGGGNGRAFWNDYEFQKNFKVKDPLITYIDTTIYEPTEGKPGYLHYVCSRAVKDVFEDVETFLTEQGMYDDLDYINISRDINEEDEFPLWRWICCYVVTGSSEGHYIHCDIEMSGGGRKAFFLAKTFEGMDRALEISNALTKVFWNEFR